MRSAQCIAILWIVCCYAPPFASGFGLNHNRIVRGGCSSRRPTVLYPPQRSPFLLHALKSLDAAVGNENNKNNPEKPGLAASLTTAIPNNTDDPDILPAPTKLGRLKDLMWIRETQEDVTAAEFACSVEKQQRRGRRAVDYEKLLVKLNQRLLDLGCSPQPQQQQTQEDDVSSEEDQSKSKGPSSWLTLGSKFRKKEDASSGSSRTVVVRDDDFVCWLDPNQGMGRFTYTQEQRVALLERIVRTRHQLMQALEGANQKSANDPSTASSSVPKIIDDKFKFPELPELPTLPKEDNADAIGPKLYVRDDGTVDWDGALQDQAALREFGTAVWARINGRSLLEEDSDAKNPSAPTANIPTTAAIEQSRTELDQLRSALVQMEQSHIQLLNSAIAQGQATANIKLASLEPQLRSQIQESAALLDLLKLKVSFQTLVYEMERIFTYLLGELGNPAMKGYIPLQDRLNVAEFGLLESQMESFRIQFMNDSEGDTASDDPQQQQPIAVDEDVLAVVLEQLTDFKRRLGIDYYVTGLSLDREAIARWLSELWMKTKSGLAFYVKGVQLFWNDIVFCLRLVNRAAQGYTLKPREVRTIRCVQVSVLCSSLTYFRSLTDEHSKTLSRLFRS